MPLTYEPVTLDASHGDVEGRLVYRDGRLLAIATRLSEAHGEAAGRWFVEVVFNDEAEPLHDTFDSLAEVEARLAVGARVGA